jgi:hypothetical protein
MLDFAFPFLLMELGFDLSFAVFKLFLKTEKFFTELLEGLKSDQIWSHESNSRMLDCLQASLQSSD